MTILQNGECCRGYKHCCAWPLTSQPLHIEWKISTKTKFNVLLKKPLWTLMFCVFGLRRSESLLTIVTEVKHYSYNHISSSGKAGNSQPIKQRDRDSTDYTDQIYCIWAHTVFGQKFYLGDLASLFTFSGRDWEMSLGNKWAMDLDCVGGIFFFQQVDRCHSSWLMWICIGQCKLGEFSVFTFSTFFVNK